MAEKHTGYFEGVLQLRNPSKEVLDFVHDQITGAKSVKIAKEVWLKTGVDLYLSNNKFLLTLGRRLKSRFKGVLDINNKLFTRKKLTSKLVYRVTVLFKLAAFKIGDELTIKGIDCKILSVGRRVRVQDLKTGKKSIFDFDEVQKKAETYK